MTNLAKIYKDNFKSIRQNGGIAPYDIYSLRDNNNNNILQFAIINNDIELIKELLDIITNIIDCRMRNKILNNQNDEGNTAAHLCLLSDNNELAKFFQKVIKKIDDLGGNLSIKNNNGFEVKDDEEDDDDDDDDDIFEDTNQAYNNLVKKETSNLPAMLSESSMPFTIKSTNPIEEYYSQSYNPTDLDQVSSETLTNKDVKKIMEMIENNNKPQLKYSETSDNSVGLPKPTQKIPMIYENSASPNSLNDITSEYNKKQIVPTTGGKKKITGTRMLFALSQTPFDSEVGGGKQSDDIHQEVITTIMNEYGYTEDEAKALKSSIYRLVKERHPDANNLERAELMKKELIKIKKLDPDDVRKMMETRKSEMEEYRANNPKKDSIKKDKVKIKKTEEPKKEKKEKKEKKDSKKKAKK